MTGTIRIGGALVLGILIVLVSLRVSAKGDDSSSEDTLALTAPARTYIESQDSDGDGVKDWEEVLQERFIDSVSATSSENLGFNTTEEYVPPTTLTGKFSEAFFQDYLDGKVQGVDYSDPSVFIADAIGAIEKNVKSRTYSRIDITIIPATPENIHMYGNTLADIITKNSINNESEMLILERALKTDDPSVLAELKPIEEVYAKTTAEALRMEVPDSVALQHIAFLNASEAILTDLKAMQFTFDDPLYTLARVKGYKADTKQLYDSFVALKNYFDAQGITFVDEDPGKFFYIFDI